MHPHDICEKGTYKLKIGDDDTEIDISAHFGDFDASNDIRNLENGLKFVWEEIEEMRKDL